MPQRDEAVAQALHTTLRPRLLHPRWKLAQGVAVGHVAVRHAVGGSGGVVVCVLVEAQPTVGASKDRLRVWCRRDVGKSDEEGDFIEKHPALGS
jgi:hypothetical protein